MYYLCGECQVNFCFTFTNSVFQFDLSMSANIFLQENLPHEISHDELKNVFSEFGKVVYVSIPKYQNTRSLKGFAFVEFDSVQDAAETIRVS